MLVSIMVSGTYVYFRYRSIMHLSRNNKMLLSQLIGLLFAGIAYCGDMPDYSRAYDPGRDPFADGKSAIALAAETGRKVLIEVGGDWCTWCHVLERTLRDNPPLARVMNEHYVLLKVNVSEDNHNTEFMRTMPVLHGYPQLFVAQGNGDIMHAQDPSEFIRHGSYDPDLLLAFLKRWAIGEQADD